MSQIIQIDRLSKHFGDVVGVDDVSLSIGEGEFVTLLGPSGCGKSTLLRVIGGFEEPTAGRIFLDGQDVTGLPSNRRAVNMVFQDYALFPHMNAGKNVGYGLRVSGHDRKDAASQARDALDLVGLGDKFDAMPGQLSGGQRQRVALARAIVRKPKVLLLDEPLSALDANLRESMQLELRHLHTKVGLTFLMVTHDQTEALTMSDRVVVMREGKIVQDGAPATLYDQPGSPYVAGFIGTTNMFSSRIEHEGSEARVWCFGQMLVVGSAAPNSAEEMLFGFRPEKVRLVAEDANQGNLLRGKAKEILYRGNVVRVVVQVGEAQFFVDVQMSEQIAKSGLPGEGGDVVLEIAPHKIMCFGGKA